MARRMTTPETGNEVVPPMEPEPYGAEGATFVAEPAPGPMPAGGGLNESDVRLALETISRRLDELTIVLTQVAQTVIQHDQILASIVGGAAGVPPGATAGGPAGGPPPGAVPGR